MFVIDNEVKAYFIGFIQTDGSMARKYVQSEINERDSSIFKQFQKEFGGRISCRTKFCKFPKKDKIYESHLSRWRLGSVAFVEDLNKLGMSLGTKHKKVIPIKMPKKLERHYIRGLIDGDGSLGFSSGQLPFVGFTTASTMMRDYISDVVLRFNIQSKPNRNQRDEIYNLRLVNENAVKFVIFLYVNSSIYLPRKKAIAKKIVKWTRPPKAKYGKAHRWTQKEIDIVKTMECNIASIISSNKIKRSNEAIMAKCYQIRRMINLQPCLQDSS